MTTETSIHGDITTTTVTYPDGRIVEVANQAGVTTSRTLDGAPIEDDAEFVALAQEYLRTQYPGA